ncbi:hypothetical protein ABBQ32_011294 [Trebouxia sp. C0010 RCD-2024]
MIDQDAKRQTHHQQQLGEQAHKTLHPDPALAPVVSQLHMNASAACTKLGRQQHSHPIAEVTVATASQLASLHAPYTAQLTALGGQTHASHEANATPVTVPCMHGTKRGAASSGKDSGSTDGSHRAKQQKQEERRSSQHAMPGLQHHPSQEGMPLATLQQESGLDDSCLNDTVGAVFIDASGHVGAGVSSGGIAMKTPGRVGEAAMYACGCWAADADPALDRPGVACSVSGVGEVIMRACLAKECCQRMLNQTLSVDEACSQVMQETTMQEAHPNDCGVLAVRFCIKGRAGQVPAQAEIECAAVHYSNSMGIGWCSQACTSPECQVLRQQISDAGDQRLVCTGCFARCDLPGYQ